MQDRTGDCVGPRIRRKWTLIRATTNHKLGPQGPSRFLPGSRLHCYLRGQNRISFEK